MASNIEIKDITTSELLIELLSRSTATESPKTVSYHSPHSCFVVGIAKDHSVSINIDNDALNSLIKVTTPPNFGENNDE